MTKVVDFPYLVTLLNPYLTDATGPSLAETAKLLLEHVTNGQIHDYSDASITVLWKRKYLGMLLGAFLGILTNLRLSFSSV